MAKHAITIEIEANSKQEAERKLKDLLTIAGWLTAAKEDTIEGWLLKSWLLYRGITSCKNELTDKT